MSTEEEGAVAYSDDGGGESLRPVRAGNVATRSSKPPHPGPRLKHARLVKGYTLRQLAAEVKCSESMISKLENGRLDPSISLLHRLASALGTSIAELFMEDGENATAGGVTVFRADRRTGINVDPGLEENGSRFGRILPIHRTGLLQANILSIPPGAHSQSLVSHAGEEFGYLISGELEVIVAQTSHFIKEGDVIYFSSSQEHGYRNTGEEHAEVLWVNTPPTL